MHGGDSDENGQFHPMVESYKECVVVLVEKGEEMELNGGNGTWNCDNSL